MQWSFQSPRIIASLCTYCSFDYEDYGYQPAPLVKVMLCMLEVFFFASCTCSAGDVYVTTGTVPVTMHSACDLGIPNRPSFVDVFLLINV